MSGLGSQGVEQFGRSEALFSGLYHHLPFLDHMHEFDPDQSVLGCLERFEPQHRPCHPLHPAMILCKYSVNPLPSSEKQHFPAKAGIT
jgi:hypothetical protein